MAWYETDGTTNQIYVKHLSGSTWVQDGGSLNVNAMQNADGPRIAISNSTPYVTWSETNGTAYQVYVKYLNGSNWVQPDGSLNVNAAYNAGASSIATYNNGTPYVAWSEGVVDQLYVKHLNGNIWVQDGNALNINTLQSALAPKIAISNNTIFVVWNESTGAYQGYVKHWVPDRIASVDSAFDTAGKTARITIGGSGFNNCTICIHTII